MSHRPIPAIVLAGGRTSPEFAAEAGVENRALAAINGWPMVRYVLRALREAESISHSVLVAPEGFPEEPEADEQVTGGPILTANLRAGLARCEGAPFLLIVTADIPFLTGAAVDDLVRRGLEDGSDCCYCGVTRAACEERFPGMRRTYLRMPNATLTGGNVCLLRTEAFERLAAILDEAHRRRKNPAFLVRLIGLHNLVKLLTHRLTLEDIERSASRRIGIRCRLLVTPFAELGTDVDKPEDLRIARSMLSPPK